MMLISNTRMLETICAHFSNRIEFPKNLARKISQGFIENNGVYVFKYQAFELKESHFELFHDETGIETALNSFSVEKYTKENILEVSYMLALKIYKKWNKSKFSKRGKIIIIYNKQWASVKFHVEREGQAWLGPNLEEYDNSISVIEV